MWQNHISQNATEINMTVKIPEGNRCHLPKGLSYKQLNEGTICGDVVRTKGINKGR